VSQLSPPESTRGLELDGRNVYSSICLNNYR
jgi:hypothetical protein